MSMQQIYIRLKSKKKKISNIVFSLSILIFIFTIILSLNSFVSPNRLASIFKPIFEIDSQQESYQYISFFSGESFTSEIIQNFDYKIDKICNNHFDFNQEESNSVIFLYNFIELNNSNSMFIGIDDGIFNKINNYHNNTQYLFLNISQNNTKFSAKDPSFNIKIDDYSFDITNTTQICSENLLNYSNSFANFIFNETILRYTDLNSVVITRLESYGTDLSPVKIVNPSFKYKITGYQEVFNLEKYNGIIWSKNAKEHLFSYFNEIKLFFENSYTNIDFHAENPYLEAKILSSESFINITFLILRIIQIFIFIFPFLYLILLILQYYNVDKDFEQNELLRGQDKFERNFLFFLEFLLIIISSATISLIILFVFMKIQYLLFVAPYQFDILYYIISISIVTFIFLMGRVISEIIINRSLKNDDDFDLLKSGFSSMQRPIKISIFLVITGLFIFIYLQDNGIIILSLMAVIGLLITCCIVISLFLRLFTSVFQLILQKIWINKGKKLSKTYLLFSFWNKYSYKKIFIISLILFSFIIINVGSTVFVNIFRTNTIWELGSPISVSCDSKNSSEFRGYLETNREKLGLVNYISYISIHTDFNVNDSIYKVEYNLMGIDYQNWIDFYGEKKVLDLLETKEKGNSLFFSKNNSILLSYQFKEIGYNLEDQFIIPYYNSSEGKNEYFICDVNAFVKSWPVLTSYPMNNIEIQSKNIEFGIIPKDILTILLNASNVNYQETFLLNVKYNQVNEIGLEISNKFSSFSVNFLDMSGFIGIEQLQSSLLFQTLQISLIFGILALYFGFINVSTISKRKSIILAKFGLVTNHRKILRNCLIIEGIIFIISYILSLMLASLFANLASLLLSGINLTFFNFLVKNILYLSVFFLSIIALYQYLEFRKFSQLKIKELFRYPE
ncbi:MAG: hypothetical protein K9W44_08665 [Candidatus Lokiarchaeota archaeon]|nr:hypothetical protein [Candidatus Harpocratesius repetitus]